MTDKVKRLTRQRQAETGEPYTLARRKVIEGHQMSQFKCTCEEGNDSEHVTSTVEDCPVHGTRFGGL